MNNTIPKKYNKEYLTVGIATMPPGPHLTQGDVNKYREGLKKGDVIKATLIVKMDGSSGHIIEPQDAFCRPVPGALKRNHEFVIKSIFPSILELVTTYPDGTKWLCYVNIRELYLRRGLTKIYGIRRIA